LIGNRKGRIKAMIRIDLNLKIGLSRVVFQAYEELEKRYPERIIGIDAGRSIDEISKEIQEHIDRLLGQ